MNIDPGLSSLEVLGARQELLSTSNPAGGNDVAEEFEAVFASMLLKQMRSSLSGESLIPSDHGDVIGGMFDTYLGQAIGGGLGIAELLSAGTGLRGPRSGGPGEQ